MNKTCVLIPHYNNPDGLYRSIASIAPTECVDICIVDDGSKDRISEEKTNEAFLAKGDIKLIYLTENGGIVTALNAGLRYILSHSKYKYIARLDCGDRNIGERFRIQEEFMASNPEIALCGTSIIYTALDGEQLFKTKPKTRHKEILKEIWLRNPFAHPSVIFKTTVIKKIGYYSKEFAHIEDYVFFFRLAKHFKTANLDIPLVRYEVDQNSITGKNRIKQLNNTAKFLIHQKQLPLRGIIGIGMLYIKSILPRSLLIQIKKLTENKNNTP
ncbi:MAG: glycosyltransferase [Motiliproteus sp.]